MTKDDLKSWSETTKALANHTGRCSAQPKMPLAPATPRCKFTLRSNSFRYRFSRSTPTKRAYPAGCPHWQARANEQDFDARGLKSRFSCVQSLAAEVVARVLLTAFQFATEPPGGTSLMRAVNTRTHGSPVTTSSTMSPDFSAPQSPLKAFGVTTNCCFRESSTNT